MLSLSGEWRKKSRYRDFGQVSAAQKPPNGTFPAPTRYLRRAMQETWSQGHRLPKRWGDSVTDVGGPFNTVDHQMYGGRDYFSLFRPGVPLGYQYKGIQAIKAAVDSDDFPDDASSSTAELWSKGATAIARCEPTNPIFSASQFLGELREGVPRYIGSDLLRQKVRRYRGLGNEYLNVEFGWVPFISDFRSLRDATTKSHEILAQYERDSGKKIRRSYRFPNEIQPPTVVDRGTAYPAPTLASVLYKVGAGPGSLKYTEYVSKETWFDGCFTYHLDMGTSARDKLYRHYQEAQKLYGIELTPETVWNLTPWSWAADWFGNTGDILHNISAQAFDGLVMYYGYIMEKTIIRRDWTVSYTI